MKSKFINRKFLKIFIKLFLFVIFFILGFSFLLNLFIDFRMKNFVFNDIEELPENEVGLVLGTSKYLRNGSDNPYYSYRINTAVHLFNSGKVKYLIVSGDNQKREYNEPIQMQKDLLKKGVPYENIYLDYAGFRTLDSVIRCKEVFCQDEFTIISQEFHNKRALYIARNHKIKAIAFNAPDVHYSKAIRTRMREIFARVKAFIDIKLIKKGPRYLGDKIQVG